MDNCHVLKPVYTILSRTFVCKTISTLIFVFFVTVNAPAAFGVELADKIEKFLKGDLPPTFHFPRFKEISKHLILAKVNGSKIVITDLKREMDNVLPMRAHKRISEKRRMELIKTALNNLIVEELYYQEAKREGIDVKQYVTGKIEEIKNSYLSPHLFYEEIDILGIGIQKLVSLLEKKILIERVKKKQVKKVHSVERKELFAYYKKNKGRFIIPEKRKISSLLVRVKPFMGKKGWDLAKERIIKIHKEIMDGKDFEVLVQEYEHRDKSVLVSKSVLIHKGILMFPEDHIAFSLLKGQVSKIMGTLSGYKILKVDHIIAEAVTPFEEIDKGELQKIILNKKKKDLLFKWTIKLKKKATINILRYQ